MSTDYLDYHDELQRPASPYGRHEKARRSGVSIQKTTAWLGGGRDLHEEKVRSRPRSAYMPSHKPTQYMPLRPVSGAAQRAAK